MRDPWTPFREVESLLDQMFADWSSESQIGLHAGGDISIDVAEFEDTVEVTADVPGFEKDDISIDVRDGSLMLRAERVSTSEDEAEPANYVRRERHRSQMTVQRSVPLPTEVLVEEATAQYTNGVLTITLPKVTPGEPSGHTIDIE